MRIVNITALTGAAIATQGALAHGPNHDEPYMVHVEPGRTGEMVWMFDKSGQVGFACLVPGHFEAGMTGKVTAK